MKECSRCLVKESSEAITIPVGGQCSVCDQIDTKLTAVDWAERGKELDAIVAAAKARGDQYDCIVPGSFAKDSSFQMLYVVRDLGLKPLVVRYNHYGFRPTLQENMTRVLKELGVDCIDFHVSWKVVKAMRREFLLRRGDFCGDCHQGCYGLPMQIALKWKIPLVIFGESLAEYQSWGYDFKSRESVDELRFNKAMSQGIVADDLAVFLKDHGITARDLAPFKYPDKLELDALGVKSICLGDYIRWDTKAQVARIKSELGWQGAPVEGIPPQYDYEKIECAFQGVRDYLKWLKRGFGRTNHLANIDIRHGRMTRADGAALAAQFDGKEPASLDWFLKTHDMTREEFYEMALMHIVDPWEPPPIDEIPKGAALPDQKDWV